MARKIDADVKGMTAAQLRQEVMRLRTAFDKELRHTGNHRCWINLLAAQRGGKIIQPLALSEKEFVGNCHSYYRRNK